MPNHANITFAGHLGADPEVKYTASGTAVCNFSVATETGFGERKVTTWRRVTIFGKRGEKAGELLRKGSAVIISGEEQNRPYETERGKGYSLEVTAESWSFGGGKAQAAPTAAPAASSAGGPDDSIPFRALNGILDA